MIQPTFFSIVFTSLLLGGCIATRKVEGIEKTKHSSSISSSINGAYINNSDHESITLWNQLKEIDSKLIDKNNERDNTIYSDSAIVNLIFEDKKLSATIYENDTITDTILFNAKIQGDYIEIKRRFVLYPFILFWLYQENKTCLAKDLANNHLVIKTGSEEVIYILLIGNGKSERYSRQYVSVY